MHKIVFLIIAGMSLNACLRTNDSICSKYPAADLSALAGTYQMKDQQDLSWVLEAEEDGSLLLFRGSKEKDETPIKTFACVLDHYLLVEIEYPLVGDAVEYFGQTFDLNKSQIASIADPGFFGQIQEWVGLRDKTLSLEEFAKHPQLNKDDVLVPVSWPKEAGKPYQHFEVQPEDNVAFILFKEQNLNPTKTKEVLLEFLKGLPDSPKRILKIN